MLTFAFLLLFGSHAPAARPWTIHVHPSGTGSTFHFVYPPAWKLEQQGGSTVLSSPEHDLSMTLSVHEAEGDIAAIRNPSDQAEACAVALLQGQGGPFASAPLHRSMITMNWRAVSFEARGRQAGDEEETVRYSMCLKGDGSYPLVSITTTARASAFERHRAAIVRISESVRFRPAA